MGLLGEWDARTCQPYRYECVALPGQNYRSTVKVAYYRKLSAGKGAFSTVLVDHILRHCVARQQIYLLLYYKAISVFPGRTVFWIGSYNQPISSGL